MPSRPKHAAQPLPELLGLLWAAAESPEDDTPRLALADWLEERGGPADLARAELTRAQCALARLTPADPSYRPLSQRVDELLRQHWPVWRAELPALPGVDWLYLRRGVADRAVFSGWPVFRRHGAAAVAAGLRAAFFGRLAPGTRCRWLPRRYWVGCPSCASSTTRRSGQRLCGPWRSRPTRRG